MTEPPHKRTRVDDTEQKDAYDKYWYRAKVCSMCACVYMLCARAPHTRRDAYNIVVWSNPICFGDSGAMDSAWGHRLQRMCYPT